MNFFKSIYVLLILTIVSCSSDDSEASLAISDLEMRTLAIEQTSLEIKFFGNFSGTSKNVLYRAKNATENYQSVPMSDKNDILLSGLDAATEYEVILEVSNASSELRSDSYFFITKSVDFDYKKFYDDDDNRSNSTYSILSNINKVHVIHGSGLSNFNEVQVYLINEQKTDSLEIPATVVSDSLSFTIPNDYLSQTPRESLKEVYVGVKINDSYQYLLNQDTQINLSINSSFTTDQSDLILKVFNDQPYIDKIRVETHHTSSCSDYSDITFVGEFLSTYSFNYWAVNREPNRADLTIFDSEGKIYDTYIYEYGVSNSGNCNKFKVHLGTTPWIYHTSTFARAKISGFPLGNYSAKIVFSFENGETKETNRFNFVKE